MEILYAAKLLRFLAMNLSGGFVFMYIYKLGYGWVGVILSIILVWLTRIFAVFFGGIYVAKHGPKHGILLSNLLSIPLLIFVGMAKDFGLPALILSMTLQGIAVGIYNLAYYIDFSKVKKGENPSRQTGVMMIIEKSTAILAPIVGAWLSVTFGAHSAMFMSSVIFALSAIPLLVTREITKNNIRLDFKTFPYQNHWRNFFSHFWIGALAIYAAIWGIFVPIFIFSKENSYGVIGVLASVSSVFSMIFSIFIGEFVTSEKGARVLRTSIFGRSLAMVLAGLAVFSRPAVLLLNVLEEISGVGYKVANQRGAFSDADKSGRRVEYFMLFELAYVLGALIFSILAGIFFLAAGAEFGFRAFFVFSGVLVLIAMAFRYPAFSKKN